MGTRASDPLPIGLALLALGIGVAAVTLLSLSADNVSYARTQWMALLAMVLAAPAIVLYALDPAPPGAWWRAFWTAGLIAFLLHAWWAIFRTYAGDVAAIFDRQGWVAYSNFLVVVLWSLDVAVSWVNPSSGPIARALRFVTWALVTASFILSSAVFRSGGIAYLGDLLVAALLAAIAVRLFRRALGAPLPARHG